MSTFKPKPSDYTVVDIKGKKHQLLTTQACENFNPLLLGVGDLTQSSVSTDAIAAVFDLEGFTNFCKQIEPHLSVPLFLSEFLSWLMNQIKEETIQKVFPAGAELFCSLPFFVKFMGDGILVLWDSSEMREVARRNVIVSLDNICERYKDKFLQRIQGKVVEPPSVLRCGIARGTVYSVGNGNDFVGSCINMAARIQKLQGATFAFNRRGFDLESSTARSFMKEYTVKRVSIRGIGDNELIALRKCELESMKGAAKQIYREL